MRLSVDPDSDPLGCKVICLKGQLQEIFDLWFFHQTNPPGTLIYTLNIFEFGFEFDEIFKFEVV